MRRERARTRRSNHRTASLIGTLASVLGLAGCNGLVSTNPWYSQADTSGAPQLRSGLWRLDDPTKPCAVDETKPVAQWPDCAAAVVIHGSHLTTMSGGDSEHGSESMDFLLAAGDPLILQLQDAKAKTNGFAYIWLRATKLDARKRAIAIRGWEVGCRPPATPNAGSEPAFYPGLSDLGQDGNCVAESRAAVQAAAASTERDYPNEVSNAHWVRDGAR